MARRDDGRIERVERSAASRLGHHAAMTSLPATPAAEPDLHRLSRHCWGALETIQAIGWLAPQPAAAYAEHGLRGRVGYFAARSAPMGAVGAGVVTATFYVLSPSLVAHAIPMAWERIAPADMVALRYRVVIETL